MLAIAMDWGLFDTAAQVCPYETLRRTRCRPTTMTIATEALSAASHPLAGKRMTGAEMVVQVLADEGVDTIFGYSGGAILPTYDAVFRHNEKHRSEDGDVPMPLIVPANEQGAGFMAAGYARATGRVGVCMVTSGPGATNTVTPVRDCLADSVPIIVICGQVPTHVIGTDAFQEAPVSAIMGSVAKHVFLVTDPARLESTVRTAFEIARSGRPGPVVIDIPKDVQNAIGEFRGTGLLPIKSYRQRVQAVADNALSASAAKAFFQFLTDSKRPLLYVGGGVINGEAAPRAAPLRRAFPDSRRDNADGHRRSRHHERPVAEDARHARHGLCELCR